MVSFVDRIVGTKYDIFDILMKADHQRFAENQNDIPLLHEPTLSAFRLELFNLNLIIKEMFKDITNVI